MTIRDNPATLSGSSSFPVQTGYEGTLAKRVWNSRRDRGCESAARAAGDPRNSIKRL